MANTPRKPGGIQAPRLPKILPLLDDPSVRLADGETFTQRELAQCDFTNQIAYRLHFEEVVWTQVDATASRFEQLRMEDARLVGCNLANAAWPQAAWLRVECLGCRMTGLSVPEVVLHDTVFKECKGDLAQFYGAKLRGVRFDHCQLTGADFRTADLTGATLLHCDLTNADCTGAILKDVDLRTCQIEGMRVGIKELQGATVDEGQALALVRALGVKIG